MEKADALGVLWDFLFEQDELEKADLILGFGCNDTAIAGRAARLFMDGWAPRLLFSGGLGKGTEGVFAKSEAETFADVAAGMGVPRERIWLETRSVHTGENLAFSRRLLKEKGFESGTVIVVHRPTMGRRIRAALDRQWADAGMRFLISPETTTPEEHLRRLTASGITEEEAVSNIVGDFQRMDLYARLGYQAPRHIPPAAWTAFETLVKMGYGKYVIR